MLLAALAVFAAPQAPEAYVAVECPQMPIYFENGTTEPDVSARGILNTYRQHDGGDFRVVLRTHTIGEPTSEVTRLSEARADIVRTALIENGIPPDHILISHTYSSEPRLVDEGWVGGWVYPEFFIRREVRDRVFRPGAVTC